MKGLPAPLGSNIFVYSASAIHRYTYRDKRDAAVVHGLRGRNSNRRYAEQVRVKALEIVGRGGVYAGRILRGDKPEELPVVQSAKFQFVINLRTARAIGIDVLNADEKVQGRVIVEFRKTDALPRRALLGEIEPRPRSDVNVLPRTGRERQGIDHVQIDPKHLRDFTPSKHGIRTKVEVFAEKRANLRVNADVDHFGIERESALEAGVKPLRLAF